MGGDKPNKPKKPSKTSLPAADTKSPAGNGPGNVPRKARSLSASGTFSQSPSSETAPPEVASPKVGVSSHDFLLESDSESIDVSESITTLCSDHRPKDRCPCEMSKEKMWMIDCSQCKQHWHLDCVSLNGLGEDEINKLVDYLCPLCYVPPIKINKKNSDPDLCQICRAIEALCRANNQYEINLAKDYQVKVDEIIKSTSEAASANTELIKKLNEQLEDHKGSQ